MGIWVYGLDGFIYVCMFVSIEDTDGVTVERREKKEAISWYCDWWLFVGGNACIYPHIISISVL